MGKPYWDQRREKFAQALAEDLSPEAAGNLVGYSAANSRRNARREDVMARVAELRAPAQAKLAEKLEITLESLLERAEQAFVMAKDLKQPNAMVNAVREMGVLTGNRVERSERGQPGEFDHLSDEELRQMVMERTTQLLATLSDEELRQMSLERVEVLRGSEPSKMQH